MPLALVSCAALSAVPLEAGPLAWGLPSAPASGRPCPVASPSVRPPDLSLVWVDVAGVAGFAFPEASREAVALLDRMGVRATVRRADAHTVTSESDVNVILLPARPRGARLDQAVMGATHRSSQGGRALWVYADGVRATLGMPPVPGVHWSPAQRRHFAVALGRVVVHEVVHAVAPGQPHVKGGLMAGRLGRSLLSTPRLRIDLATSEAFRAGLSGWPAAGHALAALPDPPEPATGQP